LDLWNGKDKLPNGVQIPAYPLPNTNTSFGSDNLNILGYTFAAPQRASLNTYLAKLDYNITSRDELADRDKVAGPTNGRE
jgi:hypothetical protein